jgi:hypothetical protein
VLAALAVGGKWLFIVGLTGLLVLRAVLVREDRVGWLLFAAAVGSYTVGPWATPWPTPRPGRSSGPPGSTSPSSPSTRWPAPRCSACSARGSAADLEHVARRRRHRADRGGLRVRVRHRRLPRHRAARRPPDRRLPDRRPAPAGAHRRRPRRHRPRCRCRLVVAHRRDGAVRADRHRCTPTRSRTGTYVVGGPLDVGWGPGVPLLRPGRLPVARPRTGPTQLPGVRALVLPGLCAVGALVLLLHGLPRRRRPAGRRAGVRVRWWPPSPAPR